jgi:hypothetical protein
MGGGLPLAVDGCLAITGLLLAAPPGCCSNIFTKDLVGSMDVKSVSPFILPLPSPSSMLPSNSLATMRSFNLRCKAWAR